MMRFTRPPRGLIAALLIPYLFLQVQVAMACVLQIAPIAPNSVQDMRAATAGDTCATPMAPDQDNCCNVGFHTAADLIQVSSPTPEYATDQILPPPTFKIIYTQAVDFPPTAHPLIFSPGSAQHPVHFGTLTYLKTQRLRI